MYPLIKNTLIKDLITHASLAFEDKTGYRVSPSYVAPSKVNKTILYPLSHLNTMPMGDDKRVIKYIVTHAMRLLLSRGDQPKRGHAEMSNKDVLAAGYLFLNDDRHIIGISNESPDFEQQSVYSLIWPLLILQLNRTTTIAEQFSVIDSNSSHRGECSIDSNDRIAMTMTLSPKQRSSLRKINESTVILSRENGVESPAQTFFTGLKSSSQQALGPMPTFIIPSA
jgi:hypothetical protein